MGHKSIQLGIENFEIFHGKFIDGDMDQNFLNNKYYHLYYLVSQLLMIVTGKTNKKYKSIFKSYLYSRMDGTTYVLFFGIVDL